MPILQCNLNTQWPTTNQTNTEHNWLCKWIIQFMHVGNFIFTSNLFRKRFEPITFHAKCMSKVCGRHFLVVVMRIGHFIFLRFWGNYGKSNELECSTLILDMWHIVWWQDRRKETYPSTHTNMVKISFTNETARAKKAYIDIHVYAFRVWWRTV